MSVQEIIEQIKVLPTEEQQEVAKRLQEATAAAESANPDRDQTIVQVFDEHDELFQKLAQ